MLTFFRRLRQNLLKENRFSKYLLYAIGEIILVMIGILLALQVSNWNKKRLDRISQIEYLENIKTDLVQQHKELISYKKVENTFYSATDNIKKEYSQYGEYQNPDSLFTWTNTLLIRVTFTPKNTTFKELNSSGNLHLIENDSLKKSMVTYYQTLDRYANIISNNNTNFIDGIISNNIQPLIVYGDNYLKTSLKPFANLDSIFKQYTSNPKLGQYAIEQLKDPSKELLFSNMVNLRMSISHSHAEIYQRLINQTNLLIEKVDKELSNND